MSRILLKYLKIFSFLILYFFTILNLSGYGNSINSNQKCILIILFMIIFFNLRFLEKISIRGLYNFYFLMASWFLSICINNGNLSGFFYNLIILLSIYFFSFLGEDKKVLKYGSKIYFLLTLMVLYDFKIEGLTGGWNTNVIGMIGLLGGIYLGLNKQLDDKKTVVKSIIYIIFLVIFINLLCITDARSTFVGLIMIFLLYKVVMKNLNRRKLKKINIIIFLIPIIIIIISILLYKSNLGNELNKLSFEITGKSFLSGREEIWIDILNSLKGSFLFGKAIPYGGNTHNIFLHLIYQFGILGYFFYSMFFIEIINSTYKVTDDKIIRYCISSFYAIYLQQSFEILLFDLRTINLINYLILSILIGRKNFLEKKKGEVNGILQNKT